MSKVTSFTHDPEKRIQKKQGGIDSLCLPNSARIELRSMAHLLTDEVEMVGTNQMRTLHELQQKVIWNLLEPKSKGRSKARLTITSCRSGICFSQDQVVIRHLSSHDLHVRVCCTPTLKALPCSGSVQKKKPLATSDPQHRPCPPC